MSKSCFTHLQGSRSPGLFAGLPSARLIVLTLCLGLCVQVSAQDNTTQADAPDQQSDPAQADSQSNPETVKEEQKIKKLNAPKQRGIKKDPLLDIAQEFLDQRQQAADNTGNEDSNDGLDTEAVLQSKEDNVNPATQDAGTETTSAARETPDQLRAKVVQLAQRMQELEQQYDTYDRQIGELSLELGIALAEAGDYENGAIAVRRSLHVDRINNGLDSVTQIPALETLHDIYNSSNNFEKAASTLDRLLYVNEQNYGAISHELIDLLKETGLWHFSAYRFEVDDLGPQHLISALEALDRAQRISHLHRRPYDPELSELSVAASYAFAVLSSQQAATDQQFLNQANQRQLRTGVLNNAFRRGKQTLIAGLNNAKQSGDIASMVAATLLYGDWHQLYQKRFTARDSYQVAYQLAADLPNDHPLKQSFRRPTELPHFNLNSMIQEFGTDETIDILIGFDVTEWGSVANAETIKAPDGEKRATRSALRTIRTGIYRPVFIEGNAVPAENVRMLVKIPK